MVRSCEFAILQFAPLSSRQERLNIGIVIFRPDTLEIRLGTKLQKLRALSGAISLDDARDAALGLTDLDKCCLAKSDYTIEERFDFLKRFGAYALTSRGTFTFRSAEAYEAQIARMVAELVDPEPGVRRTKPKRTRVMSELRKYFRKTKVLARADESVDSHRIVLGYQIDQGLVADMVLRNGVFHVTETVDAFADAESIRRLISDIAVSTLVLERAKMRFGEGGTRTRLIYSASISNEAFAKPALEAAEHTGCQLVNWRSDHDKNKFIGEMTRLAQPLGNADRAEVGLFDLH